MDRHALPWYYPEGGSRSSAREELEKTLRPCAQVESGQELPGAGGVARVCHFCQQPG